MDENKEILTGKTKKCRYCASEIDESAKVCPICKRKQKHTGIRIFITVLVVIAILLFVLYRIVDNAMKKELAEQTGQESISGNDIFTSYDVKAGDGGYWLTVYANSAYGDGVYIKYLVDGYSDKDRLEMADVYNWYYYVNGKQTTYEAFYIALATNMYSDMYDSLMDSYSDMYDSIMDSYTDYFGNILD